MIKVKGQQKVTKKEQRKNKNMEVLQLFRKPIVRQEIFHFIDNLSTRKTMEKF